MSTGRNTATRDRHRAAIRRTKPPCGICGAEIDYSLHYLDPMAYVVDHIVPLAKGGLDELANKQAAHRRPKLQPDQERQDCRPVNPADVHHLADVVTTTP